MLEPRLILVNLLIKLGVAAAFAVHVTLSVVAGGLLTLAPKSVIDFVTAGLFLAGAIWMLRSVSEDENEPGPDAARMGAPPPSFLRVFATSFTVVFIGEWGDVTQITTANFVARYNDPLIIGIAALTALWTVSALAVFGGAKLLQRVPLRWVRLVGAVAPPVASRAPSPRGTSQSNRETWRGELLLRPSTSSTCR